MMAGAVEGRSYHPRPSAVKGAGQSITGRACTPVVIVITVLVYNCHDMKSPVDKGSVLRGYASLRFVYK